MEVRTTSVDTLRELRRQGYHLSVSTRVEVHDHKAYGTHKLTFADKLLVSSPAGPLSDELREAVRANQPHLLAAACVLSPPIRWLTKLVRRCRSGDVMEAKRTLPYRKRDGSVGYKAATVKVSITPAVLAANVAAFIGKHPAHDGPALEEIVREALRA